MNSLYIFIDKGFKKWTRVEDELRTVGKNVKIATNSIKVKRMRKGIKIRWSLGKPEFLWIFHISKNPLPKILDEGMKTKTQCVIMIERRNKDVQ